MTGNRRQSLEAKSEFLYSLIAEKLLAQQALQTGKGSDSTIQFLMTDLIRKLSRDLLYREEVKNKVTVKREEVIRGSAQAKRLLSISYLYFNNTMEADIVRRQIRDERSFETILIDTTIRFMKDTVTVAWGEAETAIEKAAFSLSKGEVSPVVEASTGYYLLILKKEDQNSFYSGMAPRVLQERVEEKIRLRKEEVRMNEFVRQTLTSKIGEARPEPFKKLSKELTGVLRQAGNQGKAALTDSLLSILQNRCTTILKDTLITMQGSFWRVADVLQRLGGSVYTVQEGKEIGIVVQLNIHLKALVQQHLLEDEALARGLHQRPAVKKQLDMWREYFLAQRSEVEYAKRVTISEEEILMYLKSIRYPLPLMKIQVLKTHSPDTMQMALEELRTNNNLTQVIQRWSSDTGSREASGITDDITPLDRKPLGLIAWKMNAGERHGPINADGEFLYFELLDKRYVGIASEDSLGMKFNQAREELLRIKQQETLNEGIARLVKENRIDVYQDRLQKLPVSPSPMMTFRVLGFGGRMIAVPFVKKQVNWLNSKILQPALLP